MHCTGSIYITKHTVLVLAVVTLEGLESLQWNSGGSGDKLQQPSSALLFEGLHSFPEPFDDVAVRSAVFEPRVGLPVVDVNFTQSAHDQLQAGKSFQCVEFKALVGA